jgi:hypothetical protein
MRVWRRYLLLQIPGWMRAGLVLGALHQWSALPLWAGLLVFAIYFGKDVDDNALHRALHDGVHLG